MSEKETEADLEVRQRLSELQAKRLESQLKMKSATSTIQTLEMEKQKNTIVYEQLNRLDEDTKTYEALGHIFVYQNMNSMKDILKKRNEEFSKHITELSKSKDVFEKNVKDCENNMREMVLQWKQKTDE